MVAPCRAWEDGRGSWNWSGGVARRAALARLWRGQALLAGRGTDWSEQVIAAAAHCVTPGGTSAGGGGAAWPAGGQSSRCRLREAAAELS